MEEELMDIKQVRCTTCGSSLEIIGRPSTHRCDYCQNQMVISHAIQLASLDKEVIDDIANVRENLQQAIHHNNIDDILTSAQTLRNWLPDDLEAGYFFSYAKATRNQPDYMASFLTKKPEATEETLEKITQHLIQRSDLRDKDLIEAYLKEYYPKGLDKYLKVYDQRYHQEDQYAPIPRDVFICHSSKQKDLAEKLVEVVEEEGHYAWISSRNLRPQDSDNYWKNIEDAIKLSKVVLVVSSKEAMISKDVQKEIELAKKHQKPLIEFKFDDTPHTMFFKHAFDGIKWIEGAVDAAQNYNQTKKRIFEAIHPSPSLQSTPKTSRVEPGFQKGSSRFSKNKVLMISMAAIFLFIAIISVSIYAMNNRQEYIVEFLDYDNTLMDTFVVNRNTNINYPEAPSREGHTFVRWSLDLRTTNRDTAIRAIYERNAYEVQFFDGERLITTETVFHGESVNPPQPLGREGYVFSSWNQNLDNITKDLQINAVYEPIILTVTYLDEDGEIINTYQVNYGEDAPIPEDPSKEGYDFEGWNASTTNITNDLEVIATYSIIVLTVRYLDFDGTVIATYQVNYGEDAPLPDEPSREGYAFEGWSSSSLNITDTQELTAVYSSLLTVRYLYFSEDRIFTLATYEVRFGEDAPVPDLPRGLINIFSNWSQPSTNITKSVDIIAEYDLSIIYDFNSVTGTIRGYNPTLGYDVSIPSEIDGVTVTRIDDSAFRGKQLTSVIIPNSVTSIGNEAFARNQITSVIIPNSVTSIGNEAFAQNQITSVIIPNSVTSIGNEAFARNQITSVIIPNSITSISDGVFSYNQLTSVTIPDSVTSIGNEAFRVNPLTSVIIPNSVTSIGDYAFAYNNTLKNITIPISVTFIGRGAFVQSQFTSVVIPDSVTFIGSSAFASNLLTSVTISNSVTSIGDFAFSNNQLTSVTIPENVKIIGTYAFYDNQLTSVTIPDSVTSIGGSAFRNNPLTNLIIEGDQTRFNENWQSIGFPWNLRPSN